MYRDPFWTILYLWKFELFPKKYKFFANENQLIKIKNI